MRNKIVIGVMGVLLSCGGLTQADLITIAISGQVTDVTDQYGHLENKIHTGDAITGTYTYDSAISVPPYEYYAPPAGISLDIGGFNFRTDPSNVWFKVSIENNDSSGEDDYLVYSYRNAPLSNGTLVDYVYWQLVDSTGTALSSDTLPLTAPDLSKWDNNWWGNYLHIDSMRGGNFDIRGTITSAVLVPEPCSILLLLAGGIVFRRQKRTR